MRGPLLLLLLSACAGPTAEAVRTPTLAEVTAGDTLNLEGPEPSWAKAPGPFIVDGSVYAVGTASGRHYQLTRSTSFSRAAGSLAKWSATYVTERIATDEAWRVTQRTGLSASQIFGLEWIAAWHDPSTHRFVSLVRVQRPIVSIFDGNPELISALFRGQAELMGRAFENARCAD